MLLRYEQMGMREVDFWKVVRPLGLEVVGFRYGPWRWYRGEEGQYI
jgi:hypothetical protein